MIDRYNASQSLRWGSSPESLEGRSVCGAIRQIHEVQRHQHMVGGLLWIGAAHFVHGGHPEDVVQRFPM
ncbi:MAG: hypothetical protein U0559_00305 [Anaerolineae bacterium]